MINRRFSTGGDATGSFGTAGDGGDGADQGDGGDARGGGIYIGNNGTVIITESSLTKNTATGGSPGPIAGPIFAAALFGWMPVALWIVLGAVLIGGVQDFSSLVASLRHRARSI